MTEIKQSQSYKRKKIVEEQEKEKYASFFKNKTKLRRTFETGDMIQDEFFITIETAAQSISLNFILKSLNYYFEEDILKISLCSYKNNIYAYVQTSYRIKTDNLDFSVNINDQLEHKTKFENFESLV